MARRPPRPPEGSHARGRRAAPPRRVPRAAVVAGGAVAVAALVAVVLRRPEPPAAAPVVRPALVAAYPHDSTAFTQGLVVAGGAVYESTGLYGRSTVRRVDLATGRVLQSRALGPAFFGEGLAALGGRLYQLTWREGRVFTYDRETLAPLDTLAFDGEAWGLAADGDRLVLSDGSDRLRWLDPVTLAVTREVAVRDGRRRVGNLNELEVVGGLVYANVWGSARIAVVDAGSGAVVRWLDFTALQDRHRRVADAVLNGIAHEPGAEPGAGRLLITGKLWPTVYAVDLDGAP